MEQLGRKINAIPGFNHLNIIMIGIFDDELEGTFQDIGGLDMWVIVHWNGRFRIQPLLEENTGIHELVTIGQHLP